MATALGIGFGLAISNISVGIALGVAIGAALEVAGKKKP
jgi:F0F1-type ATP synthase membrane subunit c/vacuolar-type H+-ATPase subunit K